MVCAQAVVAATAARIGTRPFIMRKNFMLMSPVRVGCELCDLRDGVLSVSVEHAKRTFALLCNTDMIIYHNTLKNECILCLILCIICCPTAAGAVRRARMAD